jgi:type II secretory pathway component PulF
MHSNPPAVEYATPTPPPRRDRPATNVRVALWLFVLFATAFCLSRWVAPREAIHFGKAGTAVPLITVAFLSVSKVLASVPAAVVMAVLTVALPAAFARVAWTPERDRYAYRRLLAIHLVTCALLAYLLFAALALLLPFRNAFHGG